MANVGTILPQDHIKALDSLRSRLAQLSTSITLLKQQLEFTETIPPWPSLQKNATSVEYNLRKVGDSMMSFQNVFATAHAYPLPQFPGTSQEHLLQMLLRKKLEPRAEDWLEEALQWHTAYQEVNVDKGATDRSDMEQLKPLWDWARPLTNEIANGLDEEDVFRDNFTIAERQTGIENVNTGIRKNLDIYGEEDDDEDDDNSDAGAAMVGVESTSKAKRAPVSSPQQAPLPLVDLLRFMSSGATPSR